MPYSADYSECTPVSGGAGAGRYGELYDASIADPEAFWVAAARDVTWIREPRRVLDDANPPYYRWFPDAVLNTCVNALDGATAYLSSGGASGRIGQGMTGSDDPDRVDVRRRAQR